MSAAPARSASGARSSPSSSPTSSDRRRWGSGSIPRRCAGRCSAGSAAWREAIERHGGTVENYIGDAVMAVFGIPVAHEDDALRAVRAAADMRDEVAVLRDELRRERGVELAVRIGVNTGEAVTGDRRGRRASSPPATSSTSPRGSSSRRGRATSCSAATPFASSGTRCDAEPVAPLTVKGKQRGARGLPAARASRPTRAGDRSGRARRWSAASASAAGCSTPSTERVADRSCQLFTVLGAAGVGKSRLVAEVVDSLDGAATVAGGPLPALRRRADLVAADRGARRQRAARAGGGRGRPRPPRAAELLKPAGEPVAPEEAFWAVRKVLEALARRRPLVLVVDDLQWAEPDVHRSPRARGRLGARRAAAAAGRWRAPSCSTAGRAGAAASRTRRRCCSSRWPTPTRATCCGSCVGPARLGDRDGRAHPRRRRGQPAVRRGGRRHADRRRRPVPGDGRAPAS